MGRIWMVLDCNFLCYRAFYSTSRSMSWKDAPTGTLFGFFRDLLSLSQELGASVTVFAFDHGLSLRYHLYPAYKAARKDKPKPDEEVLALGEMERQLHLLKTKHLKGMGYQNILFQTGYEADDHIAAVVRAVPSTDQVVVVSADKDLYQLLGPTVRIWNPIRREFMTEKRFRTEYGIRPCQWVWVKAIAGCLSDGIRGVLGVGEKSAVKYIRDECTPRINVLIEDATEVWHANLKLVRLPMDGVQPPNLQDTDNVTVAGWNSVVSSLGMKSLVRR